MNRSDIQKARLLLRQGEVIGIPTETVYGLAGNAYDEQAIRKIFAIKGRPLTSPLIVHTHTLDYVYSLAKEIPPQALTLAKAFWPGPLTLLLEKKPTIPDIVTAGLPTVGIRIPNHPLTRTLMTDLSFPLAAPSANPFGYISPTTYEHVEEQLGDRVSYILDGGPAQKGLESTIVGFPNNIPTLYRLGSITQEAIQDLIGPTSYMALAKTSSTPQLTPGRTKKHYSPRTPLHVGPIPTLLTKYSAHRIAALSFDKLIEGVGQSHQIILSPKRSLQQAARSLFAALHQLDKLGADIIIAPIFPAQGLGNVINERLQRASTTS